MAYDEQLADRTRRALGPRPNLTEKKMFGGLAFLLDGKMFCGISNEDLMLRVGPERYEAALAQKHVRPMDFTGRPMNGYVFVGPGGARTDRAVQKWVELAAAFVGTLGAAAKRAGPTKEKAMGRNRDVDAWFAKYDNPMSAVVQRIREIVLAADARIDECIKWQAPTFTYRGNLASFFPKSKQHASLMFHLGAKIPGTHPRLEGSGETARVLKIGSIAEANAAKRDIEKLVRAWCDWRDAEGDSARPTKKRSPPKRAPGKKRTAARTPASRKR